MAFQGNNPKAKTFKYTPLSADPTPATEGQIYYNDGTSRTAGLYQFQNGAWKQVGADSVGSSDVYTHLNADNDNISNWTNTGSGTFTFTTSSPLSGDRSYSFATAAQNDQIKFIVTPQLRNKGKENSLTLQYTMDTLGGEVVIYDTTNAIELERVPLTVTTDVKTLNFSYALRSNATTIEIRIENTHVTNTPTLIFDDIQLSDSPFVYKNLIVQESARFNTVTGYASTNIYLPYFTNETHNTLSSLGVVDNSPINGFSFTATKACTVDISASLSFTASSHVSMTLNGDPTLITYDAGLTGKWIASSTTTSNGDSECIAASQELVPGDVLRIVTSATTISQPQRWSVHIVATAQSEHVVTPATSGTEYARFLNAADSANIRIPYFATEMVNTVSTYGTIDNNATTGFSFTATKACILDISASVSFTGATETGISLNADTNTGFLSLPDSQRIAGTLEIQGNYSDCVSTNVVLKPGDVIRVHAGSNYLTTLPERSHLTLTARPVEVNFLAAVPVQKVAYLKDVKPAGTSAGASVAGIQTRTLNTIEGDTEIVSLNANQFTLAPGKYKIDAIAPSYVTGRSKIYIYNVATAINDIIGTSVYAVNSSIMTPVKGTINITQTTVFELRQYCELAKGTDGLGVTSLSGDDDVYATVEITKLK